ncbi:MAG: hypothetical protein NDJ24_00105 [Alphaproteobacteria bacterium]|nr:hypothetical protein [Alphaproteobacteria bacterium]
MSNSTKNTFNQTSLKRIAASLAAVAGLAGLGGCSRDAQVASENLSRAADNFEINRRIVFYNGITDTYMLTVEGRCSIEVDAPKNKLDVTCKTGPGAFKKHFLGKSDNVTYFVEQLDSADVSTYHYRVEFKPQSILPDVRVRGDAGALEKAVTPQPR